MNIAETFVRADGAFIPFAEDFDMLNVTTSVKGIGEIGDVNKIDLQSPVCSVIGRQVVKVGRSSGLTTGNIMAYALEYNDEKGICFFTDFLVVGENQQTFDLEGDSGSLILLTSPNGEKPRPIGIIWGGTANRGRLKLKVGQPPENWTSGVDLGRLLDLLELDLITSNESLRGWYFSESWISKFLPSNFLLCHFYYFFSIVSAYLFTFSKLAALQEQRNASAAGIFGSAVGESSPAERIQLKDNTEEIFEPINLNIRQDPVDDESDQGITPLLGHQEFHIRGGTKVTPRVEHQFIPGVSGTSLVYQKIQHGNGELKRLSVIGGSDEEMYVSLQLGEREQKRRKQS